MRYPNHIILDVAKLQNSNITNNWTSSYTSLISKTKHFNNTLNVISNIKLSSNSITSSNHSTVVVKSSTPFRKNTNSTGNINTRSNSLLWSLFDINFLKKEKMYTKLKYSRSPQYDIVSGGVAALFAGFIGFLISEKFGIELVDSGDFYTFFMYIVFLCFATRPFFRIMSKKNTLYHFVSLKFLLDYCHTIVVLTFKALMSVMNVNTKNISWISSIFTFLFNNEYLSTLTTNFSKIVKFWKRYPFNK